jgi:hypothetical protein
MNLRNDILRNKVLLFDKARRQGLYENFGQKEVNELRDKYDYNTLIYGTEKQRQQAELIDSFDIWCMNFSLEAVTF